ncbi:MAG TPA: Type 1 glutamine amidotransferase-like domain-containing protein [Polyangia bacterium]|jgi:peptidase E|nr:Type 1 glutamine amidotransferase-like domain-containing protein [Polyangia bacterium]
MTTTVHLIGGGPGAVVAMRRHLKDAVKAQPQKKPLVGYVGAASNDNAGFRKMLGAMFLGTGACLEPVQLARKTSKTSVARQLLHDCDLVFMSGGDVEHGMKILDDRGVSDDLRSLAAAGKPFVGVSAGSIMTCHSWVRFPDDDDARAEPFACLGIVPVIMDAHSEADDWSELRVLIALLNAQGDKPVGYGVPSKGCLRVELAGDGKPPKLQALGAPITRVSLPRDKAPLSPA